MTNDKYWQNTRYDWQTRVWRPMKSSEISKLLHRGRDVAFWRYTIVGITRSKKVYGVRKITKKETTYLGILWYAPTYKTWRVAVEQGANPEHIWDFDDTYEAVKFLDIQRKF